MNIDLDLRDQEWAEKAVQAVRDIAGTYAEQIKDCQRAGRFPAEVFREMGRRGLLGVITPEQFGG